MTIPAIPIGPYSAIETAVLIARLSAATAVVIHGRCSEKNVRVSSRFTPLVGRLNANQNRAVETCSVELGPKAPCW